MQLPKKCQRKEIVHESKNYETWNQPIPPLSSAHLPESKFSYPPYPSSKLIPYCSSSISLLSNSVELRVVVAVLLLLRDGIVPNVSTFFQFTPPTSVESIKYDRCAHCTLEPDEYNGPLANISNEALSSYFDNPPGEEPGCLSTLRRFHNMASTVAARPPNVVDLRRCSWYDLFIRKWTFGRGCFLVIV